MKQIPVIIERSEDGTYSVYCKDEMFSGMGVTINDAKTDMHRQIAVYKEIALKEGFRYPEFLDGEYAGDIFSTQYLSFPESSRIPVFYKRFPNPGLVFICV